MRLHLGVVTCVAIALNQNVHAQGATRARDLGIPFEGTPGTYNAITDVAGVEVGYSTIIRGGGKLVVGQGPVRTGVTAILPRGKSGRDPVFGAWFTLNAAGEMTGTTWLEERGFLEGPVLITNTHSVGIVRDVVIDWMIQRGWKFAWTTPVVAETYDGSLNDINGFHVRKEHVFEALDGAVSGRLAEGNVGGGTGMICHQFKGGTGTASRKLAPEQGGYTIGVLVQCNYGSRQQLRIAGAPLGAELADPRSCYLGIPDVTAPSNQLCNPTRTGLNEAGESATNREDYSDTGDGSIIIVVATDAPVLPHQLKRITKRAALGIGRMGGTASNGSGDIFVAFSTANANSDGKPQTTVTMLGNNQLTPIFEAVAQATEEAITNALIAAETMTGANGFRVFRLPHDRLQAVLQKYNRLTR